LLCRRRGPAASPRFGHSLFSRGVWGEAPSPPQRAPAPQRGIGRSLFLVKVVKYFRPKLFFSQSSAALFSQSYRFFFSNARCIYKSICSYSSIFSQRAAAFLLDLNQNQISFFSESCRSFLKEPALFSQYYYKQNSQSCRSFFSEPPLFSQIKLRQNSD